ncbi:MAG: TIR domain-containing protein [Chloroflexi bacterium]|nr:MAG: TIR domain-containing protein [Chloroflexota bacterium]
MPCPAALRSRRAKLTRAGLVSPLTPTAMPKPVFISYATDDTAAAEQMRDGLEAASIACWMAPRDIAPGLEYGSKM